MSTQRQIIGIGSPFGDDQAGWAVIDALEQMQLPADTQLLRLDRPGTSLLSSLNLACDTTLIDALLTEEHPPGHWLELKPEQLDKENPLSSHGLGLAHTLALANALGALPKHLRLIGICIAPQQRQPRPSALTAEVACGVRQLAERLAVTPQTATGKGGVGSIGSSSRSDSSRK